jgi:anti-sigma factor RsiW
LAGRPAAALVYFRRQHAINVYVWSSDSPTLASRGMSRDGFQALAWSEHHFNFLAVSEIPADELESFATEFRNAMH